MVRLYVKEPYSVILVHEGPGAIGSLKVDLAPGNVLYFCIR